MYSQYFYILVLFPENTETLKHGSGGGRKTNLFKMSEGGHGACR